MSLKLWASFLLLLPIVSGQAVMSALLSTAYGPGLRRATVGEPTQFWIQTVDSSGLNMTIGGGAFKINMKSPYGQQGAKPTITDLGTGLYHVTYTIAITYPPVTGVYTMEIIMEVNGVKMQMRNSPFTLQVIESAPFDSTKTFALSPPDFVVAGGPGQFKVVASDSNGNALTQGFLTFVVQMSGGAQSSITYTGVDGEYMVDFLATKSGPATLNIQAGAPLQDIAGSPYSIFISPGPVSATACEAEGPGLVGGTSGKLTSFTVTEVDTFGNLRNTPSSVVLSARFDNDPTKVSFSKQKNATWIGTFVAPVGAKTLRVEMDGVPIAGSPFQVHYTKPARSGAMVGILAGLCLVGGGLVYYRHRNSETEEEPTAAAHPRHQSTGELPSDSDDGVETGVY